MIKCFITARIRRMGEGNVFSLFTSGGGSGPAAGGGQVQLPGGSGPAAGGGVRSSCWGGSGPAAGEGAGPAVGGVRSSCRGGQVQLPGGVRSSCWGGGSVQLGGVSILYPLAGGMPLAFTQEDFLVFECIFKEAAK